MIDFLRDCDISEDTIDELYDLYSFQLFDLSCNSDEIIKIIDYLRSIGIVNIEDLLINKTDIFYKTKKWIEDKISKYNIDEFVSKVNDNYDEIEIIFK